MRGPLSAVRKRATGQRADPDGGGTRKPAIERGHGVHGKYSAALNSPTGGSGEAWPPSTPPPASRPDRSGPEASHGRGAAGRFPQPLRRFLAWIRAALPGGRLPDTDYRSTRGCSRRTGSDIVDRVSHLHPRQQDGGKRYDQLLGATEHGGRPQQHDAGLRLAYDTVRPRLVRNVVPRYSFNAQAERVKGGNGKPWSPSTTIREDPGPRWTRHPRKSGETRSSSRDVYRDGVVAILGFNRESAVSVRRGAARRARYTDGGCSAEVLEAGAGGSLSATSAGRGSYEARVADSPIVGGRTRGTMTRGLRERKSARGRC